MKRNLQRLCRKSRNSYLSSLLDNHSNVTKRFWSFIKHKHKDQVVINTLHFSGEIYTEDKAKADVLNNNFSSIFTRENITEFPRIEGERVPDIPLLNIQVDGVRNPLENPDPLKSPGPDNISSRFLKETAIHIAPSLTFIFQAQGIVPSEWKKANVVYIYIYLFIRKAVAQTQETIDPFP